MEDIIPAYIPPEYINNAYEIRLTDIDDNITPDRLKEFLGLSTYWAFGEEYANNHHFHIILWTNEKLDTQEFKKKLYDFFKPSKIGNPFYSLKPVKEITQYIPYLTKDGQYYCPPTLDELLEHAYEVSFPKPLGITEEKKRLAEDYLSKNLTDIELWTKYGEIYVKYDKGLNVNKGKEFLLLCQAKRNINTWINLFPLNTNA